MNSRYLLKKIGGQLPETKMVVDDQDAWDIMSRMMLKHKNCACDYSKIADDFAGDSTYSIANNLWMFCKNNLQYKEESIHKQFVSSPQTMLARGYCDCKGYALFIGGVLDALNRKGYNIRWKYRFASDDPKTEIPGHVFIVIDDNGSEIWIDPVLNQFNEDHYFYSYQDRKVSAKVAGCGCNGNAIGATTSESGTAIIKISAPLAAIPVVGWIGAAAGAIVGGIVTIVGSKWNQSNDVRWLIQLYQFYVMGQKNVTSDHLVNEALTQTAQAYFSVVTGVPIGGRKDLNILQSGDGNTNTPTGQSADQRANNYLIWKNLVGKIPMDNAVQAANIAARLNFSAPAGGWASLTPAPSTIVKDAAGNVELPGTSSTYVNSSGELINAPVAGGFGGNKMILIAAAAAIALILIK